MVAKDKLGRVISVGDYIVYGHALGRSAGLKIGRILKLQQVPADDWRAGEWRIRVQGVDDDYSDEQAKLSKPGTLQFPERTLRVDFRDVPAAIILLLAGLD